MRTMMDMGMGGMAGMNMDGIDGMKKEDSAKPEDMGGMHMDGPDREPMPSRGAIAPTQKGVRWTKNLRYRVASNPD